MLELGLLGPVTVTWHGAAVAIPSSPARLLLALLGEQPGRARPRAELARLLWPERPQTAASTNLRQVVARLRAALPEPDAAVTTTAVSLCLGPAVRVDVLRFADLLAECGVHDHPPDCAACTARRAEAAALYRGEFGADLLTGDSRPLADWLLLTRERLQRQAVGVLHALAVDHERAGDHAAVRDAAGRALQLEPWREEAHRQLMTATAALGDRAGALAQYERCARALHDELGVTPDPRTTALRDRIRGDRPAPARPAVALDGVPRPVRLHGRAAQSATLRAALTEPGCGVCAVVGLGGVGKTALAVGAVHAAAPAFDVVVWRSLRNAPPPDALLRSVLAVLAPGPAALPTDAGELLDRLEEVLRRRRCLLVLDNLESVLDASGWRPGHALHGQLIARLAAGRHRSRLLLTSRERPPRLDGLVGDGHVRVVTLTGLDADGGRALLAARGLAPERSAELVAHYSGNPLALTLVARTVQEIFGADVDAFLATSATGTAPVFDDIRAVLDEQYDRLPAAERALLDALAVAREPVRVPVLRSRLLRPGPAREFVAALAGLERRCLLEPGDTGLTLQNVIMEFVTERVVEAAAAAVRARDPAPLDGQALLHPAAPEHVRDAQIRLVVHPVVERLAEERADTAAAIPGMLAALRAAGGPPGYAAGNLLNLALRLPAPGALDLSGLCVRQADLRGADPPALDLTDADLTGSVFTERFGVTRAVAIAPDGGLAAVGTDDGDVRLWRLPSGEPAGRLAGHGGRVEGVAFAPDGATLASTGSDGSVRLWDVAARRERTGTTVGEGAVGAVAVDRTGHRLAVVAGPREIRVVDAATGTCLQRLTGHDDVPRAVAFGPDGSVLAAAGPDGVRLWEIGDGRPRHIGAQGAGGAWAVAFEPAGRWVASGGGDGAVRIWRPRGPATVLAGHSRTVRALAVGRDGAVLASAGVDRAVRLWDTATWTPLRTLHGHRSVVHSVAFGAAGDVLVSAAHDQTVRVWDTATGECLRVLHGHSPIQLAVAFSPDGGLLATGGMDAVVRIWDVATRRLTAQLRGHTLGVGALAWGRRLASGGGDGDVRLWEPATGRCTAVLRGGHEIADLAFDTTGTWLSAAADDAPARVWDVTTGRSAGPFGHPGAPPASATITTDGTEVVGISAGTVWRWERSGRLRARIDVPSRGTTLAVHPDGRSVACDGPGGAILLTDGAPTPPRVLAGHDQRVAAVRFSPDGTLLASAANDGTVRVWDTAAGTCRHVLHGHGSWAAGVACHPDGALLASAGADGDVRLWDARDGSALGVLVAPGPYARMRIAGVRGLAPEQLAQLRALGADDGVQSGSAAGTGSSER